MQGRKSGGREARTPESDAGAQHVLCSRHARACTLPSPYPPCAPPEWQVLPQHGGNFPTAQTCGNKLYLPEYDSADELRLGLAEAFANTEAGGLHEHAG